MKKLFFSLLLVFISVSLFPSNDKPDNGFIVNATIVDKQNGESIVGAKIELKNGTNYYTDLDGKCLLQTSSKNDELVITAIGYEPFTIKVSELSVTKIIELTSH